MPPPARCRAASTLALLAACLLLADGKRGGVEDVEHVVIFMQENRPFDHYYGRLAGVRGFNDPRAAPVGKDRSVFQQPTSILHREEEYMLPFHIAFNETSGTCMSAPRMDYPTDILMWARGRMDAWNTARDPGFGMSYFDRDDLPFYYALSDAFTVGDQYFQSTFTATNPNRLHLFTGSNGLSVGKEAVLDDSEPKAGFDWPTMAEVLEAANVSWKVYQEVDNFDDNAFEWFYNFKQAKPGNPLYDKAQVPVDDLVAGFTADLANDTLPQVSWIVARANLSEHAQNHPADGEDLSARLIKALRDHPEVYAKTAFIINYDEGGQFFDHHWTPTPPTSERHGKSTVSTEGEVVELTGLPIGMGFRVPLIVVSPWSRGNYVVSEVLDHTSVVQFLELRFGVHCPNISPWRRAVAGDLTSAFNFSHFDDSWPPLPDTSGNVNKSTWECHNLPGPTIPARQQMPVQEPGTRPSRPLPYSFNVSATVSPTDADTVDVRMQNVGNGTGVFLVLDRQNLLLDTPRTFTVEGGKVLEDSWRATRLGSDNGVYDLALYGPNGFAREFRGSTQGAASALECALQFADSDVTVTVTNPSDQPVTVFVMARAHPHLADPAAVPLVVGERGGQASHTISMKATYNWYDIIVSDAASVTDDQATYYRRHMGHHENGQDSTSDPWMGFEARPESEKQHPDVPVHLRHPPPLRRGAGSPTCDGRTKDACDAGHW